MTIEEINLEIETLKFKVGQIENELKKVKENKGVAIVMMIVSIFFLWPLLIVGGLMYLNNNSKANELNSKKSRLEHEIYRLETMKYQIKY